MINLYSNWEIKPGKSGIFVNGDSANQFLVLAIALFVISALLMGIFGYYLWKFSKQKAEVKIVNKLLIGITFALPVVSMIMGSILLAFWLNPESIFGLPAPDANADNLFAAYISVAIVGFLVLIVSMVTMWIWLPKYAIALTENQIMFVGDFIPYSRITKIIKDEESGKLFINYTMGKRSLKKQKFSLSSTFGQFLLTNANVIGIDVTDGNQEQYVETFEVHESFAEETLQNVEPEVVKTEMELEPELVNVETALLNKTGEELKVVPVVEKEAKPAVKKTTTAKKPAAKKTTTTTTKKRAAKKPATSKKVSEEK